MRYLTVSGIAAVLLYLGFVARCGGTAASSFAARHRALGRAEAVATSTTRLSIDDASGVICSLVHTGSGRDFAAWAGSGTGTLYAVEFAAPAGTITSADAARVNVTRGADGTAVAVFRHDKPFPVTVTCRFRPERNTRYLLGRISLRAEQSCRIAAVTFPVLRLSLPLSGTGADDAVVLPGCDGIIVQDPLRNAIARDLASSFETLIHCVVCTLDSSEPVQLILSFSKLMF